MVGVSNGLDQIDWSWMCMLKGGWLCLQKSKKASSRLMPAQAIRSGGDCGPDTAGWLLNEHGPALYRSRSPETCSSIRNALKIAWSATLHNDASGDDGKAFVSQRLEQVPHAALTETLEQQIALVLQALLRSEDAVEELPSGSDTPPSACDGGTGAAGGKEQRLLPYWFLPEDWARLSEAYQVDFVLHGLPGTESCHCAHCGCNGHLHVGPRRPGMDLSLHVGWRGLGRKKLGSSGGSGDTSNAWGHWEPLGAGPIQAPLTRQKSSFESEFDLASIRDGTPQARADPERHASSYQTRVGVVETILHDTLASLGCIQPEPCGQVGKHCAKLKDCCNADRRVSEDGIPEAVSGETDDFQPQIAESMEEKAAPEGSGIVAQQSVASTSARSFHAGARFSVMLEGFSLFDGVDLTDSMRVPCQTGTLAIGSSDTTDMINFKTCFVESVAIVAGISQSRIQVLDVSLPFEAHSKPRAPKTTSPNSKESPSKVPDIGAGVLSFLDDGEEQALPDSCDSPMRVAVPPPSPASPTPEISVVRVLAVIREAKPGTSAVSRGDEQDAMMSLELVVNELADPLSRMQHALRNGLNGTVRRIWCPEAEGPCKGPHRNSAVVAARARRAFPRRAD